MKNFRFERLVLRALLCLLVLCASTHRPAEVDQLIYDLRKELE